MNDFQMYEEGKKEAEVKQCDIHVVRLRSIIKTMKVSGYDTVRKTKSNIRWFYLNLHVHNENHKDYKEAMNLIQLLLNK